jgi:hypothetical protein
LSAYSRRQGRNMIFVSSRHSFPRLYRCRSFGYLALAVAFSLALLTAGLGCGRKDQPHVAPSEVRIGYFGNLTHAQAVLGVSSGEFASAIAPAKLSTKVFNAGPSLIEAVLAGEVDIGYVGPGPVLNGHLKSRDGGAAHRRGEGSVARPRLHPDAGHHDPRVPARPSRGAPSGPASASPLDGATE